MKKELILIFSYYGVGGAQRRAINLGRKFVEKGYHVTVLSVMGYDGSIEEGTDYFGISGKLDLVIIPEFYQLHKDDFHSKGISAYNNLKIKWMKRLQRLKDFTDEETKEIGLKVRAIRNSEHLRRYLIQHQNAVIIHFGFNIFDRTYFAAKGLRFKIIYAETNASNKYMQDSNYLFTKKLLTESDGHVFQTKEQQLEHGQFGDYTRVIANPVKENLPDVYCGVRKPVIVNFCRMSPQKNLVLLVEAFAKVCRIHKEYKLHIYADVINEPGINYKNIIQQRIHDLGLDDSVCILPASEKIHDIIKDAAMFVSSSDYEGISNSMIEAMAMGLPCVCTDCAGGGAKDMIIDGYNGLLVPVNDVNALADAMLRMIEDKAFAEKCGKNALEVRDELAINRIAEEWLQLINLVEKRKN